MTRLKFDTVDIIVALIVGVILGIFATFCFSSPSSEASSCSLGTGFIGLIEPPLVRPITCVGVDHQSAPTFTDSRSAAALPISPETWAQAGFPARQLIITAYCPKSCCCGEFADGITASGHVIQPRDCFVAAPPDIPFGTRLSIPGYAGGRMVPVEDRGGKIKGNRLDVFFDSHSEALAWGIQHFEVKNEKRN